MECTIEFDAVNDIDCSQLAENSTQKIARG